MAKTFGYGLQAFAGGFATGLGLGMENKKIKMIQEEKKRAEKLAKEKEENAMNWYNTNKDSLINFHTQPQDIRNMLILGSINYKKEWTDYLRDIEDFLQSGDLEGLKHLNDITEEAIKAERDMLKLGIRPENAFIGKYYTEENMEYVKKLQMGKLPIKPIGTQMYEEEFGKLPAEVKEPTMADEKSAITLLKTFVKATPEQYEAQRARIEERTGLDLSVYTQDILRETGSEMLTLYDTPEEVMANVKAVAGLTVIPKRDTKTGKYYGSFSKETVTGITEAKPETVTTLKNWEEMFDVNAKEGPRTEEEYNRALNLLAQSEDKYKPKYATWKEALIAEVKGIGKELEGITDRTDRKFLLDVYKRKLEEIKAKYPDVDLSQFSRPKELSGWDKFLEKVGF